MRTEDDHYDGKNSETRKMNNVAAVESLKSSPPLQTALSVRAAEDIVRRFRSDFSFLPLFPRWSLLFIPDEFCAVLQCHSEAAAA